MINLTRPIVFFDIESTGLSIVKDRIIEISFVKVFPDQTEDRKTYLLNPTIPISPEATAVHGITNEKVKDQPTFSQVSNDIFQFINDSDLSGFNLLKFDIPMLMEEFIRCGLDLDLSCREIVDVQVLFHKMEERTLSAAYKFYCNKELINAHSAIADTDATYEVFKKQIERYSQLPQTIKGISEFTGLNKRADLEGRIIFDADGNVVFNFGKHKGRKVEDVFAAEPSYYSWMMDGDFAAYTKKVISDIRMRMLKNKFL
jgi:DNA polymerase-3 subunit epsilon